MYQSTFCTKKIPKIHCYDNSACYDLSEDGLPSLPNDLRIGFINGIWNDFKDAKASAQYISRLAGGYNIHAVYNATHGLEVDPAECLMSLNYIATEPVRQLHRMWNSFFEKSSVNAKFLMICLKPKVPFMLEMPSSIIHQSRARKY